MIRSANIKGSEEEFLVQFWIKELSPLVWLHRELFQEIIEHFPNYFNYAMTVLLNFAVTWDSRTEKVRAYFNTEKGLVIYINEILQNNSPLFCSVLTHQPMVVVNHVALF